MGKAFASLAAVRSRKPKNHITFSSSIARSKRDGTRAETRFGLSAKRTSPFKSAEVSVQSTTGSRGVRISGQQLYRPCSDVQCKTTGYPLHSHLSPSLPLPCVTMCHQVLNALYNMLHLLDIRPTLHEIGPALYESRPAPCLVRDTTDNYVSIVHHKISSCQG